jgi:hypothetical protein
MVQLEMAAFFPLNETVPAVGVKFKPEIVIEVPGSPLAGASAEMMGATVNGTPPLCSPPLLTTTLPVVAPFGTVTAMLLSDQVVIAAVCPLKVTVPAVTPKFDPIIVTDAPAVPLDGLKLLMTGARTVNV